MRCLFIVLAAIFAGLAAAQGPDPETLPPPELNTTPQPEPESEDGLPLAQPCDEAVCRLPNCRCSSTNIPGGLAPRDTPQFVNINFRGMVYWETIFVIRRITTGRVNSNGCRAGATFFINHRSSDYHMINDLYNERFEIALNSMIHSSLPIWQQHTNETIAQYVGEQRRQMAHFANIPIDEIRGVRTPHFSLLGNITFGMMQDYDILYDNSWETRDPRYINSLWPYTLDYASTQDCVVPPCPTASFPGKWVVPVLPWQSTLNNQYCSMLNFCGYYGTADDWFRLIMTNFERHYLGNRAPFVLSLTEQYINFRPEIQTAITRFLGFVTGLNDAFVVNMGDIVDWVKDPIPVNEYVSRPCKPFVRASCQRTTCNPYYTGNEEYEFISCAECPREYPRPGNPLGE